jgi:enamine deaminase RidA (YjgF/YER057c/UK114 family)
MSNEKQVLKEIFKIIENNYSDPESNIVIDTTGSVIYTGEEILNKLRKYTTVVYLATPLQIQDQIYRAYLVRPRPVLWQGKFSKKSHEKNKEALARCYPELLTYRERLYKHYAHITIDYDRYRKKGLNVTDFLRASRIGNIISVAGTAPIAADGSTAAPGDVYGQTCRCLEIIESAIRQAGAKLSNVIRTRVMLTDISRWEEAGRAHGEFFGDVRPACTFVEVSAFIKEDWLVEVEADCVMDD